jgi:nitric oxide dioxygenase
MTPDQIARVRASWSLLAPIAETAAARFYERLFELDPSLAPLFAAADPTSQRRKLVQTLAMVVAGIEEFDRLLPAVEALGRRHDAYGVRPEHYATVGEALLWTLRRALGDAFDDATRQAWAEAFATLAGAMTGGPAAATRRRADRALV